MSYAQFLELDSLDVGGVLSVSRMVTMMGNDVGRFTNPHALLWNGFAMNVAPALEMKD